MKKNSPNNAEYSIHNVSQLFANQQNLSNMIEIMPASIYWKDNHSVYLGGNKLMLQMAGVNDLIGKTDFDMPWKKYANHMQTTDKQVINLNALIEHQDSITIAGDKDVIMLSRKFPLTNPDGKTVGIFGLFINVSSNNQLDDIIKKIDAAESTNQALRKDKETAEITLQNIIAEMPCHVYWKNKNGVYLGCNNRQAKNLGFKCGSEIIGKTDFDLPWGKHIAETFRKNDLRIMSTGKTEIIEECAQIDDQESIVLSQKTPTRNKNGIITGILGISMDITDRKKLEAALNIAKEVAETANHAKTEFIANMSHDIRTPLTGVVGMSKLLEEGTNDPNQKQYAHWLGESGDQLLHMLTGILDVVSADNINEHDLHEESFDLRRMIQDIIELERPSTLVKDINLITHIDETIPPYFICDHTKLHRILLNLVGNAIKFTQKGCVTIDVSYLEQRNTHVLLQFRVLDTGIGIPLEMQDMVFDRFFRVTPSYKGIYTGHGVGLHIAQSYVHLLGGEIKFSSELGVGTTFYFNLSLKVGDEAPLDHSIIKPYALELTDKPNPVSGIKSADSSITATDLPQHAPNLLLIEDNLIALRVLESIVIQSDCRFTSVMDGESALELAHNNTFDLIITDLGLPGISGIELTQKIRAFETSFSQKLTPIIGLTAHAQGKVRDECLASGMNDVFSKPMNLDTLSSIKLNYLTPQPPSPAPTNTTSSQNSASALGLDLPDTEQELFELDTFPVFDEQLALEQVGNDRSLLLNVLHDFVEQQIPGDMALIKDAYTIKDWDLVERLAHKIKGGVLYCGTIKMKYACQYLERYRKAGHVAQLDKLYQQLIQVTEDARITVIEWLNKQT